MKKIMFSDKFSLTKAVLEGRKTMTRRIVPQSVIDKYSLMEDFTIIDDARYNVGEVVAIAQPYHDIVNESAELRDMLLDEIGVPKREFEAGFYNKMFVRYGLMPHHIRITDAKVERLQDIIEEDLYKEGIGKYYIGFESDESDYTGFTYSFDESGKYKYDNARKAFADLIDKVSGKGTWSKNPVVFAYEFELVD